MNGWLASRRFDLGLFIAPALLMVAWAMLGPPADSWWVYVVFIVCVDVAHVYATLYRTYFDLNELRRRPVLYALAPLTSLVGCVAVYQSLGLDWFWRIMAYLAVYHFIRQQVGFVSLFRMRDGQSNRCAAARQERWAIYAVTGFPVLWWHTQLPREFSWFMPGDFVPLPSWAAWLAGASASMVLARHLWNRWCSRRWAPARDLWLLTTAAVWFGGIVFTDNDVAFTMTNVVAHGVPYLALIAWVKAKSVPKDHTWFRNPMLFLAPLFVLAFIEEGLWDAWVWHDHANVFGEWHQSFVFVVPLLAVPQVTHYVLDAFIWKLNGQNPELKRLFSNNYQRMDQPTLGVESNMNP